MTKRKQQNKQSKKQNPRFTKDEATKETDGTFVIGRNPVIETLQSERDINKLFVQEGLSGEKMDRIISLAKKRKLPYTFVPKNKLDQLSNNGNHQGVVVAVSPVEYATIDDLFETAEKRNEMPFFLLLDGIEDPHNLGSIMRTADASGAHGIIIPKRRAVGLTEIVAKASAGAIEHVPVVRVTNLVQTIQELKDRGVWFYGTDMKGQDYREWDADLPIGLVIGNEGKGMSRLVKEQMDGMLTIPMTGNVQSLNASVAAGLLMYEVNRKRTFAGKE